MPNNLNHLARCHSVKVGMASFQRQQSGTGFSFMRSCLYKIPEEIRCVKCKTVFYFNGCPSCGNTFIRREYLRQTF